jgi:drug/metabolite transporter (DMT)-like permease
MGKQIGIPDGLQAWSTSALAALFVLCWSSGFVGAKLGAAEAPVTTILMWRFVPLAVLLLAVVLTRLRRGSPLPSGGDVARHVLIGLLSQSGYLLTVYWAIGLRVSTGTTALIDGVQPLVAAALVGPLLGVAVTGRQWAGLGLGLVGVVLVSWTDASSPATQAPTWAYLIPFVGMLSLIASTILERRARVFTPPLQALAIHCTASAMVFTVLAVATRTATPPSAPLFWIAMAWLILLATFGGYGLYWFLVERIGVTPINNLMFLIAPVTSIWGAVMFGEPLTLVTVVGLILALVAARVASSTPRPAADQKASQASANTPRLEKPRCHRSGQQRPERSAP